MHDLRLDEASEHHRQNKIFVQRLFGVPSAVRCCNSTGVKNDAGKNHEDHEEMIVDHTMTSATGFVGSVVQASTG